MYIEMKKKNSCTRPAFCRWLRIQQSKLGSRTWPLSLWFWSTKVISISISNFRVILHEGFSFTVGCRFGFQYVLGVDGYEALPKHTWCQEGPSLPHVVSACILKAINPPPQEIFFRQVGRFICCAKRSSVKSYEPKRHKIPWASQSAGSLRFV